MPSDRLTGARVAMPQRENEHAHATDRESGSTHAELNTPRGSKRLEVYERLRSTKQKRC